MPVLFRLAGALLVLALVLTGCSDSEYSEADALLDA